MENLIFSLNVTVPVFMLMMLGLFLRKINCIDKVFAEKMNKFVFLVPLPVLVFKDLASVDFREVWDGKFVIFCFAVTVISIVIAIALSLLLRQKGIRGEFIQASYRSSAALLGIAIIQNIYGTSGAAPLMIIGSVPVYNIMAVVVLALSGPSKAKLDGRTIRKTLIEIVTNPIIIGIVAGIMWSMLRLKMPYILERTTESIAKVATPMGLMAMGAAFDFKKAFAKIGPSLLAAMMKLAGFCALFLPLAVHMGFRGEKLVAILIMLGSATTVSAFVMAKNMKHEGVLTSSVVMLTTLFSAFTLTGWLYILKMLKLL